MRQIANLKKKQFSRKHATQPLSNVFQDQESPRVIYELDISVQAMRLSLLFLLTMY